MVGAGLTPLTGEEGVGTMVRGFLSFPLLW